MMTKVLTPFAQRRIYLGAIVMVLVSTMGPVFMSESARYAHDYHQIAQVMLWLSCLLCIPLLYFVWLVVTGSRLHIQDIVNQVAPGFGHLMAVLMVVCALGFNSYCLIVAGHSIVEFSGGYFSNEGGIWVALLIICMVVIFKHGVQRYDYGLFIMAFMVVGIVIYLFVATPHPPHVTSFEEIWHRMEFPWVRFFYVIQGMVGGYLLLGGAHRFLDSYPQTFYPAAYEEDMVSVSSEEADRENKIRVPKKVLLLGAVGSLGLSTLTKSLLVSSVIFASQAGLHIDAQSLNSLFQRTMGPESAYVWHAIFWWVLSVVTMLVTAYTAVTFLRTFIRPLQTYLRYGMILMLIASAIIAHIFGSSNSTSGILYILSTILTGLLLILTLWFLLVASKKPHLIGNLKVSPWLRFIVWLDFWFITLLSVGVFVFYASGGMLFVTT